MGKRYFIYVLAAIPLVVVVVYSFLILSTSYSKCVGSADAAVVLGAAVYINKPSPVFKKRIEAAVNLYMNEKVNYLIFTGGVGGGDSVAESHVGREEAISAGVAPEHIFTEAKSKTTYENLKFIKPIVSEKGISSLMLVTDPLHQFRSSYIARSMAWDAKILTCPLEDSAYKTWKSKLPFFGREIQDLLKRILGCTYLSFTSRTRHIQLCK